MSYQFQKDKSLLVGWIVSSDEAEIADLECALLELLADEGFDTSMPLIVDLTQLADCSIARIRDCAEHLARGPRRFTGAVALLGTGIAHRVAGLALAMYLSHEGTASTVFENETQALGWIGSRKGAPLTRLRIGA